MFSMVLPRNGFTDRFTFSWLMSQLSRTRVPPSTGVSS